MPTVKVFTYNVSLGHGFTDGSGFGSESISSVNYLNVPQGYCYLRNLAYREDGVLRPYYLESNLGNTMGTGAIRTILSEKNNVLYGIAGTTANNEGNLYSSTDEGATWAQVNWSGAGNGPELPVGNYTGAYFGGGTKFIFKSDTSNEPAYCITIA